MALNWSQLAPHRPLGPGDVLHVPRPQGGGDELARHLLTGGADVVAVVGPVGSGKSTELAHAASLLQQCFVVVLVPLDRLLDMRRVTEEDVCVRVALRIEEVARTNLGIELSPALKQQLFPGLTRLSSVRDLLLSVMREVTRGSPQGSLALLVDGLEKCERDAAVHVVQVLLDVRDEARLVFVAPYWVVVGKDGHDLQASGAAYHFVRAVPVRSDQEPEASLGRKFLCDIAWSRFALHFTPPGLTDILDQAAQLSGGLPRSFLQLVQAAGRNASLYGRDVPIRADLTAAAQDHAESLARLLEKGDVERLREADGKSEREIETNDRVRLLMQGLLLDYKTSQQGAIVHTAPLLDSFLARTTP
jgi:hypothetical protein